MTDEEMKRIAMEVHMLGFVAAKTTILAMESQGVLAEAGLSMLQYRVLRALRRQPYTISELSPIMMVDPSTLVSVVDALERKALAARGRDPHDRRRVPISATQEGARVAAIHPSGSPFADEDNPFLAAIGAMGPEGARQLRTLLRELVGHLPDGEQILHRVTNWVRLHSAAEPHPCEKEQEPISL